MEYLMQLLSGLTADTATVRWLLIAMVGGAIFVFGMGIMFLVAGAMDPVRQRLRKTVGRSDAPTAVGERFSRTLKPLVPYIVPSKDSERSHTVQRLQHAGYRSPNDLTVYYALRALFIIGLPSAVFLAAPWFPHFSTKQVFFFAAGAALFGLIAPSYALDRRIAKRKRHLSNGFPDAIDLLVVCTEAGLGLNAALQRVARELAASHPALAEELALVNAEIRAGVDREEALRNLARRTGLEDVKALVVLLSQSLRFGTSIAETLRVYAEEFRDKRMQRAEEAAAKIGTKMIFPLVTCMFPSFFIVAIGPAILKVFAVFAMVR